jgi:2,3-dimethylmalate lyase
MTKTAMLRKLLTQNNLVVTAGAHDALSARVLARAGFETIFLSGFGFEASLLGKPDAGLLSMSEIVNHARNIAGSVDVPVLADAESGYGSFSNIRRTIREFEQAGVAGVFLEDQAHPVLCGTLRKFKRVISMEEMLQKLKCALDSRQDPDFIICGRTDADIISIDEQIRRCNAYASAGVDMVMPQPQTREEWELAAQKIKAPLWVNLGLDSPVSVRDLEEMGVHGIAMYPVEFLFTATRAMSQLADELRNKGTVKETMTAYSTGSYKEFFSFIGLRDVVEWDQKYLGIPK